MIFNNKMGKVLVEEGAVEYKYFRRRKLEESHPESAGIQGGHYHWTVDAYVCRPHAVPHATSTSRSRHKELANSISVPPTSESIRSVGGCPSKFTAWGSKIV